MHRLRVLFVCTANICRSPYLELTARGLAGDDSGVEFASAGTHGFLEHEMDEVMAGTLAPGSADAFRSRRLDRTILEGADLVLTAEAHHRAFILEEYPQLFRKVFTVGQFAAFAQENPGLSGQELVTAAGSRRRTARPEHDIDDPYRRGVDAARSAADRMSSMLSVIVPALLGGEHR
jgi:protein-tyrosine-phosphatase